jgi:hypothetical protein
VKGALLEWLLGLKTAGGELNKVPVRELDVVEAKLIWTGIPMGAEDGKDRLPRHVHQLASLEPGEEDVEAYDRLRKVDPILALSRESSISFALLSSSSSYAFVHATSSVNAPAS